MTNSALANMIKTPHIGDGAPGINERKIAGLEVMRRASLPASFPERIVNSGHFTQPQLQVQRPRALATGG